MSTQTIEATDLELLVGDMPEVPCEHSTHGSDSRAHDEGPAEFYARGVCPSCGHFGPVQAVCSTFAAYAVSGWPMFCLECEHTGPAWTMSKILGPVKQ